MDTNTIHFVRVTTDDRSHQLWAAATAREDAVNRVLDGIPEGWSATLLDVIMPEMDLPHVHDALSNMTRGDVRELSRPGNAAA